MGLSARQVGSLTAICLSLCPVACSPADGERTPSSSASSAPSPSPSPEAVPTAVEPATDWMSGDGHSPRHPNSAGHALPRTSRVGVHPGFERVVVEYTGKAPDITWRAHLADEGSAGAAGTSSLRVTVAGVRDPNEGETMPELSPSSLAGASTVKGVDVGLPADGNQTVVIGLDRRTAYRITVLENPTRLVIDLKTSI